MKRHEYAASTQSHTHNPGISLDHAKFNASKTSQQARDRTKVKSHPRIFNGEEGRFLLVNRVYTFFEDTRWD